MVAQSDDLIIQGLVLPGHVKSDARHQLVLLLDNRDVKVATLSTLLGLNLSEASVQDMHLIPLLVQLLGNLLIVAIMSGLLGGVLVLCDLINNLSEDLLLLSTHVKDEGLAFLDDLVPGIVEMERDLPQVLEVNPLLSPLAIQSKIFLEDLPNVLPESMQGIGLGRELLLLGWLHPWTHNRLRWRRGRVRYCVESIIDGCEIHDLVFIPSKE